MSTHSLLAATNPLDLRRKPFAETNNAITDRASISMPPPITKPIIERRLSTIATPRPSRRSEEVPQSPPASIKSFDERQSFANAPSPPTTTTNTDTTPVTTASSAAQQNLGLPVLSPPALPSNIPNELDIVGSNMNGQLGSKSEPPSNRPSASGNALRPEAALPVRAPRNVVPRSISSQRRLSTPSQKSTDTQEKEPKQPIGTIGVCALDVKARSKPSRQILTRLQGDGEFEVVVFGDKAILDEAVENWPICDFLIAFFSDGFPLEKAIAYVKLRKPFAVNDLQMQKVLWDRRLCLKILDHMNVPTPKRIEVIRDGGPRLESAELAEHVKAVGGVTLQGPADGTGGGESFTRSVSMSDDDDVLVVDGQPFRKPFVEKPVDGEDHNIIIYFPKSHEGGGARRLFRKIGNKSSEFEPGLTLPRCMMDERNSYIYEQFLQTENAEDVKLYTVTSQYVHAETRKSPVVDGLVKRNTHGKEIRYVTKLSAHEKDMASKVSRGFGQRICGFDLLRAGTQSYVIDVNGWSFVKDNIGYYDKCAEILKSIFSQEKFKQDGVVIEEPPPDTASDTSTRKDASGAPSHSHRTALKTIFKSPSIKNLSSHLPHSSKHHHAHGASSPRTSMTMPLSSPPSIERPPGIISPVSRPPVLPSKAAETEDILPPPAVPTSAVVSDGIQKDEVDVVPDVTIEPAAPLPSSKHSWKLKGVVTVIRHADRTPKQKMKFTAHSAVFVELLKGHHEEVLLKGEAALSSVEAAVKMAQRENSEDPEKLANFRRVLAKKKSHPATKVQIKPMFRTREQEEKRPGTAISTNPQPTEASIPEHAEAYTTPKSTSSAATSEPHRPDRLPSRSDSISGATFSRYAAAENDLVVDKLQIVLKWGGEPTHSARYQSQDLGLNMRDDYKLLNKQVLENVHIFTSSEKRVKTSAQIWAASFLGRNDIPEEYIQVRKDLLDDSNAAKDVMDTVKRKLKHLLREGNSVPEAFAWPKDVPEPYLVLQNVIELLRFHRRVMRDNYKKLTSGAAASLAALDGKENPKEPKEVVNVSAIQSRWCTGEDPELFKERWERLFAEFVDGPKTDPSKVSELYDTMKYDALHNRQFLEFIFTPSQAVLDEFSGEEAVVSTNLSPEIEKTEEPVQAINRHDSMFSLGGERHSLAQKMGFRRKSVLAAPPSTPPLVSYEQEASYFKLFSGSGESKIKQDKRLGRLRELYRYSKILFDYIGPQEYGITDHEKLEIGLLTSLPLLREIVQDLEELQANPNPQFYSYYTKESHIYTLLNCIIEVRADHILHHN